MMSGMTASVGKPTHAGGVVFRIKKGGPQFLLITARRRQDQWIHPKGHIERRETPEQAAVREVQEEAGVNAEIVQALEDVTLHVAGEDQIIRYFLMHAVGHGSPEDGRRLIWLSVTEAMERLSFAEARSSLRQALAAMEARDLL
jgi:8-oxo-dGTP pyrophosphatase MutT (NUDIX family)